MGRKPLFSFCLGCQALVMLVNHGRGIARLRGGQIFVAVQDEMERAKRMAQPVWLPGYFRPVANLSVLFVKASVSTLPQFARAIPVRPQPLGQRGANRHETARAGLALGL